VTLTTGWSEAMTKALPSTVLVTRLPVSL